MRFKDWLIEHGGGATSGMHGGIFELPNFLNDNMPKGVRSKFSTKNGVGDWKTDPDPEIHPEKLFGMTGNERRPKSKVSRLNRSNGVPIRNNAPDIIY